jgi:hypothetical protein
MVRFGLVLGWINRYFQPDVSSSKDVMISLHILIILIQKYVYIRVEM